MRNETPKTFADTFKRNFKVLMSGVHTSIPGAIETYEGNRICSVKPQVQRRLVDDTYLALPVIEQVPVIFPSGTEFGMSWPLKKGDPVMILFCERSIEDWIETGKEVKPEDLRRFALTDAVAIPGLYNKGAEFTASNNEDFQLIYKEASIIIKKDGTIELNGNSKTFVTHTELDTALQTFITALNVELTTIQAGATAAIAASGLWTTPLVIGANTLDISSSKTTTLKTGG